jgi:hypothetical protein
MTKPRILHVYLPGELVEQVQEACDRLRFTSKSECIRHATKLFVDALKTEQAGGTADACINVQRPLLLTTRVVAQTRRRLAYALSYVSNVQKLMDPEGEFRDPDGNTTKAMLGWLSMPLLLRMKCSAVRPRSMTGSQTGTSRSSWCTSG